MAAIDNEFQSLIPPLSEDEYERLERSILAEGVRDPIVTWNGTIIDGHNRYNICEEHGLACPSVEREFESRDAAKIWIIENQFGRRNLSVYDRSRLALQLEPLYAAEAKRKQIRKPESVRQISDEQAPFRTDEQLAKLAGTSRDTIRKVKVIETEADKGNETAIKARESINSGEKSISKAYNEVRSNGNESDTRRLCVVCGKPIDEGDSYEHDQNKHKRCTYEDEKARKAKPKVTEDGRRICSICGEPINDGEHYMNEFNVHYQCGLNRHMDVQRRYRNPTIGDTSEVLTHDKAELRDSLLLVVQDMGDTMQSTINRYVTMDVHLGKRETDRILKALESLTKAVEGIRG